MKRTLAPLTVVQFEETVTLASVTIPSEVVGGGEVTGTVELSDPGPSVDAVVLLSGSRSGVATVPESVIVPAYSTTAEFTIVTHPVNYPRGIVVTASYNELVRQDVLVVSDGQQLGAARTHAAGGVNGPASSSEAQADPVLSRTMRMQPASVAAARSPATNNHDPSRRLYFYTPELNLLAE